MNKSDSVANIHKALAKFLLEVKNPPNTTLNKFYGSMYAPLADILNMVRPLLNKHGLSIVQSAGGDGERISVSTLIMHDSGEWIETDPLYAKLDKANPQHAGIGVTYCRRYSLNAALGISGEEDNDGNEPSHAKQVKPTTTQADVLKSVKPLDEPDEKIFNDALKNSGGEMLCSSCTSKLTKDVFDYSLTHYQKPLCRKCQKK
jgi:hypothetical protein